MKQKNEKKGFKNGHNSARTNQGQGNMNGRQSFEGKCHHWDIEGCNTKFCRNKGAEKADGNMRETIVKDPPIERPRATRAMENVIWQDLRMDQNLQWRMQNIIGS